MKGENQNCLQNLKMPRQEEQEEEEQQQQQL